ncbi:hypothetical protein EMCRGX_G009187 [Ephydatia muelleri]
MATEFSCGAKCFRYLFIILNSLFFLSGLGIFVVGLWLLAIGSDFSFLTGNKYASGAAVVLVIGVVMAIICLLGCVAGIKLWRGLLVVFLLFLVLILFLEIVATVLGFVFRAQVTNDFVKEKFESAVKGYTNETTDATIFVNAVQNLFNCCGVNNYTDYFNTNGVCNISRCSFPGSCMCTGADCVTFNTSAVCPAAWNNNACGNFQPQLTVYEQGCYASVVNYPH